jgi:hypothetical protein
VKRGRSSWWRVGDSPLQSALLTGNNSVLLLARKAMNVMGSGRRPGCVHRRQSLGSAWDTVCGSRSGRRLWGEIASPASVRVDSASLRVMTRPGGPSFVHSFVLFPSTLRGGQAGPLVICWPARKARNGKELATAGAISDRRGRLRTSGGGLEESAAA